jgi:RNA polymerase sigma-70 factor (ECF subfamily)
MTGKEELERTFREEAIPHMDAVYRFSLRLSGSRDAAEDLVQETFLRAYRAWDQYTPGTQAKSWLFTICRNVFLRGAERTRRHDEIVRRKVEHEASGPVPVVNPVWAEGKVSDPEGAFFSEIVDEEILRAIDDLPEEYRTAVVLSDLEGLPYAEIARVTEVPVGTVKSRLFRGRRQLQKQLFDYAVEMGIVRPKASGGER